jgi:hypothetical protein
MIRLPVPAGGRGQEKNDKRDAHCVFFAAKL